VGSRKYDSTGKVAVESRVTRTSDGLRLKEVKDFRRGYEVRESVLGQGSARSLLRWNRRL
jgi:hypothetical protein